MSSRAGPVLGLIGGMVAVAGFFMPWLNLTLDFQPLREALGGSAGPVEGALRHMIPSPFSFSGLDFLSLVAKPVGLQMEGAAGVPHNVVSWTMAIGVATSLVLASAILAGASFVLDLAPRKTDGVASRAWERLRGRSAWFGAGIIALSLFILAWVLRVPPTVTRVAVQISSTLREPEALGLDPGTAGRAVGLLDQVLDFSLGPGLYLCVTGGLMVLAGGLMVRRRKTTA